MTNTTLWLIVATALSALELFTTTFYLLAITAGFLAAVAASSLQLSISRNLIMWSLRQKNKNRLS
jgi:membrane protein implicated in regulation of membrane protease activity